MLGHLAEVGSLAAELRGAMETGRRGTSHAQLLPLLDAGAEGSGTNGMHISCRGRVAEPFHAAEEERASWPVLPSRSEGLSWTEAQRDISISRGPFRSAPALTSSFMDLSPSLFPFRNEYSLRPMAVLLCGCSGQARGGMIVSSREGRILYQSLELPTEATRLLEAHLWM